jgi:hypothetical protein
MASNAKETTGFGLVPSFMPVPALAGTCSGPLIVLGRAGDWLSELDTALEVTGFDAPVMAVNVHSGHYPGLWPVEHEVSVHCGRFLEGVHMSTRHCVKLPGQCPNADVYWPIPHFGGEGSSAMLGAVIGLNMGHEPIIMAGVHLDKVEVSTIGSKTLVGSYIYFQAGWRKRLDMMRGKVFSVSPVGTFLRDLLGGPEQWRQ